MKVPAYEPTPSITRAEIHGRWIILLAVLEELDRAREKYPDWPDDPIHALAIAVEETGEIVKSLNNHVWQQGDDKIEDIFKETIQGITMHYRFLLDTPMFRELLYGTGTGEGNDFRETR